ncbi:hypothetical protein G3M85_05185 [Serratia marcescens]|uniref:hypothetical protein n=1 Tax=Serratia TaxID=613 RepID=UPI0013BDD01C|nr:hypothetical protein [Serratia marcescens]NDY44766.1 hypothetical protein [Serratia marcescens]NDY49509.1 hypothetical protein [Serratia marcescens]NDY61995.1 hypothetical protein [Serratia marcescens]NDY66738.1 hypothetical protein [Serratia marcescens]NDY75978.1 hypothetical protein [Serratia marcescens]
MQDLEREIYDVLAKSEATVGLGSSETANKLIEVARPFYQKADHTGKYSIINRLNAMRKEPGIPFPENLSEVLGN